MLLRDPIMAIFLLPVIIISLTFHEFAHAFVAYRLGDPTARDEGRLTLNPLKHLDILGTIMMLISSFGWAKPVPIRPLYFKDPRKGAMLVSVAGPLSNILLALIFLFFSTYIKMRYEVGINISSGMGIVYTMCYFFYIMNINLAVFNILPVPPLDGSKILSGILPQRYYYKMLEYENYMGIIFLVLIFMLPGVLNKILSPLIWVVETALNAIVYPIINALI